MNKKIILIGGGGHCKSVLDSLLKLNEFSVIGIVDKKENVGETVLGVRIIGCDQDLPHLFQDGFKQAFVTVGSVGSPQLRIKIFNLLTKIGFGIPNIVDPSAVVSNSATMAEGIYVGKNAVINAGAVIHTGVIINTGAIIEHDCSIGDYVHVSPGSVICGNVEISENTHIGAGCVIKQQLKIGPNSVIGMGSVVLSDIGANIIAYGNPCKEGRFL